MRGMGGKADEGQIVGGLKTKMKPGTLFQGQQETLDCSRAGDWPDHTKTF